jgi:hypothetical protein
VEVARLLRELNPNAAAIVVFILATSAELGAVQTALRAEVPDVGARDIFIRVKGTKNKHRNRVVPIVLDEQHESSWGTQRATLAAERTEPSSRASTTFVAISAKAVSAPRFGTCPPTVSATPLVSGSSISVCRSRS